MVTHIKNPGDSRVIQLRCALRFISKTSLQIGIITNKISAEEKKAIENGISDLKKSLEGTDAEDIKKKTQSLIQVSMKLGEAVYKSQQKPGAGKSENPKDAKPNDKDNVVDADFEDVKEKEEDKEKSA